MDKNNTRLYHFDGGVSWFVFEDIKDDLWLTDQTGIIDEIEEHKFTGTEDDLLALLKDGRLWNRFYSDWVVTGIGSQHISSVSSVGEVYNG